MNSLIACNSYKSQAWPKKDGTGLTLGQYSHSYGTTEARNGATTSYLQGVA